jgi:single-stranded DNA-binding protein
MNASTLIIIGTLSSVSFSLGNNAVPTVTANVTTAHDGSVHQIRAFDADAETLRSASGDTVYVEGRLRYLPDYLCEVLVSRAQVARG